MATATISWPSNVNGRAMQDGYSETPQNAVLRTDMDMGQAKQRRRFTAISEFLTFRIFMTKTELTNFKTFWTTTSKYGSIPFSMVHPTTQAACVGRFVEPYTVTPQGLYRIVSVKIEVLP